MSPIGCPGVLTYATYGYLNTDSISATRHPTQWCSSPLSFSWSSEPSFSLSLCGGRRGVRLYPYPLVRLPCRSSGTYSMCPPTDQWASATYARNMVCLLLVHGEYTTLTVRSRRCRSPRRRWPTHDRPRVARSRVRAPREEVLELLRPGPVPYGRHVRTPSLPNLFSMICSHDNVVRQRRVRLGIYRAELRVVLAA